MILDESLFEKKEPSLYNKVYDNLEKLGYSIFASTDIDGLEISKKNEKNLQRAKDWLDKNNIKYNTKKLLDRFYIQIPTELTEDIEKIKSGKIDEKLENNEIDDFFNKAKKLGVKNLKDLKILLDDPAATGKTDKEKMDNYYKEANPEDNDLNEDLSMTSKTIDNSKINFNIKDNGDFTFSVNGKEYKGHTDKPEEMSKDMEDFGFSLNLEESNEIEPNSEEVIPDSVKPGPEAGIASIINNLIIDEWEAIQGYNDAIVAAELENFHDIAKVLRDIVNEENLHVGQLEQCMKILSPNTDSINQGEVEASEQLAD